MHARALKITITDSVIHGPCQPASLTIQTGSQKGKHLQDFVTFNLQFVICERIQYSEKVLSVCDTRLTPPIVPYSSIWLQEHTQKKRCFPLWVKEENHLFHVCLGSNIQEESWNWWGGVIYCEFSLSFDVTHMCSRAGQYICLVETNFGSF